MGTNILPVIALIGRSNVGKSTLFNRLIKSCTAIEKFNAIVGDSSELTRDRIYGNCSSHILIDTGGLSQESNEGLNSKVIRQTLLAIEEADVILFIVNSKEGLTYLDQNILDKLRRYDKPFRLVANKIDGSNPEITCAEFSPMGIEKIFPISAMHGTGISSLEKEIESILKLEIGSTTNTPISNGISSIKIAIIGRPNVGKSTLANHILEEDRVIVHNSPGTTRDSIHIPFEHNEKKYTLVDTAGVRRRAKISEKIEVFSVAKTLMVAKKSDVTIFVMDATEGVVDQDLNLIEMVLSAGRSVLIVVNKWDSKRIEERNFIREKIKNRLQFISFIDVHFASALKGTGLSRLYQSINNSFKSATASWPTNKLNKILASAISEHAPPMVHRRRIKPRYAHLGGNQPTTIVIHGNQVESIPETYVRYLENTYRSALKLIGTPIRMEFKNTKNPYKDKKNILTDRQIFKRKRLMSFNKTKKR